MKSFLLMLIAIIIITIVTLPVIIGNTIRKIYRKESLRSYFFTIAIGFDQAGGSIIYGQEDWTISSWTYILSRRGNRSAQIFVKAIDFLFGKNHCENSYSWESVKQGWRE